MGMMRTPSGMYVDLAKPYDSMINVEDVATLLSRIPRWGGCSDHNYTVAEHSVHVLRLAHDVYTGIRGREALGFLLHDAHEAYLGDVVRPLKEILPDYQALEARWAGAVRKRFDLLSDPFYLGRVTRVDDLALSMESCLLFPGGHTLVKPSQPSASMQRSCCWSSIEARRVFLCEFYDLQEVVR